MQCVYEARLNLEAEVAAGGSKAAKKPRFWEAAHKLLVAKFREGKMAGPYPSANAVRMRFLRTCKDAIAVKELENMIAAGWPSRAANTTWAAYFETIDNMGKRFIHRAFLVVPEYCVHLLSPSRRVP